MSDTTTLQLAQQLHRDHDLPAFWQGLPAQAVRPLQEHLQRRVRRTRATSLLLVVLLCAATLAVLPLAGALGSDERAWAALASALLVPTVTGGVVLGLAVSAVRHDRLLHLQELLQPLSSRPRSCSKGLALLKLSAPGAHRDRVLAQARELTVGDLRCMRALAQGERQERRRNTAACRRLHDLQPESATQGMPA